MNCPACNNELSEMIVSGITVDVCKGGCGGIWFDNYELEKFSEARDSSGEELLNVEKNPGIVVDYIKKRICPKCNGIVMMRHFWSVKRQVEVDECPSCGGFWLDAGELAKIRDLYETEAEKTKAVEECFDEVFGDKLAAMKKENEEKLKRAQKIAHIFRFVCPSYYIPGKQGWGAF
ncbi:MAG: zf-TFIIB domain-containing protein [Sedimentisphaerales bacterium]